MSAGRVPWFRAVLTAVGVGALAVPAAYFLAVTVSPPFTAEGHRVMPLPQLAFALAAGTALSLAAAVLVALRGRR